MASEILRFLHQKDGKSGRGREGESGRGKEGDRERV